MTNAKAAMITNAEIIAVTVNAILVGAEFVSVTADAVGVDEDTAELGATSPFGIGCPSKPVAWQ
jgi:hypothetical protein